MQATKALLAVALGAVTGVGGLILAAPRGASAAEPEFTCPNTNCLPSEKVCYELTGWQCTLSGGCSGSSKCGKT